MLHGILRLVCFLACLCLGDSQRTNSYTVPDSSGLPPTGFNNPMYSGFGYTGTRVLETNYYSKAFEVFNFSQQATVDLDGDIWLVDKELHVVLKVPKSSRYLDWPAYHEVVAGRWKRAGYLDGSNGVAMFNAPLSLAVWERTDGAGASTGRFLLVADTGNHCVRRVSVRDRRTITLAGKNGQRGHRDGDGGMALLDTPTSIGVESTTGKVMVLDGGDRLRLITVHETADDLVTSVVTIVKGACRSMAQHFILSSIVVREVWCHTHWSASSVPQELVEVWQYPYVCVGHIATCGPRNHPAISDRSSAWLQSLENFTQSQNQSGVDPNLETGTFVFIEMSTILQDTFTVISSVLHKGYSVQVGDVTSELPGMKLDTARRCLFAYAQQHNRDVEIDFCVLGNLGSGETDMVIISGKEGLDRASSKFDRVLARYVYRLRVAGSEVKCSPHALAPTVLHATTSDECREIVTDVKNIAPKAHEVPLSATQIEITKAQEKANPLAAMFAKAAQKKAAKKKEAENDKAESTASAAAKEEKKSPARGKAASKTTKTAASKAKAKDTARPTKAMSTPKKSSPSSSPTTDNVDEDDEDDDDIMVMPKKNRRGAAVVKRQREATPEKSREAAATATAKNDLFSERDVGKEEPARPGDGRVCGEENSASCTFFVTHGMFSEAENSSVEHNGGGNIEVKRRKKTTKTKFSLGDNGYMEVEDVVGFKEDSQPVKKAAPAAAKPKPKPTPCLITESFTDGIKGMFREIGRGKQEYPFNPLNPANATTNRLGRKKKYCNDKDSFRFGVTY
ncbi:hypothetical protein FOL46_007825 [Perkinsus olseni]|uniref:Uncharacterized protein n=1 Tax=Perkinsus olseni TaxID=32597 RepID=A0A7J6MP67_PEROL|nr:hypothetical protein FOL46_007825 [Perkinsus olseni]